MPLEDLARFVAAYPSVHSVRQAEDEGDSWTLDFQVSTDDPSAWSAVLALGFGINVASRQADFAVFLYPFPDPAEARERSKEMLWRLHGVSTDPGALLDFLVHTSGRGDPRAVAPH